MTPSGESGSKMPRDVLVIGGGIAGIQAALDLSQMGIPVHLVEKNPCIGGRMAQLDKTFPTNDCSICILSPKMIECFHSPNVTFHTLTEVKSVSREGSSFSVKLIKKARYVNESLCTGCGRCVEKCPMRVPDEFDMGLGKRRAIYFQYLQGLPSVATIDRDHCLYFKRGTCRICEKTCDIGAIDFEQQDTEVSLNVGSIVVATGYRPMDPSSIGQYGYGRYADVITALEFERLISASGPTAGHLERPSDGVPPRTIAFIQCVGSRDVRNSRYCSQVCCMHSTKEAILTREHDPETQAYVFYADLRAAGKGFRRYVARAESEYGVKYVRGRVAEVREDGERNLLLRFEDVESSETGNLAVDLVVLATCLLPSAGAEELARVLGLEIDEYGFFKTRGQTSTCTSRDGVYACGYCAGPVDISESVTQAGAAAARAAEYVGLMLDER